MTNSSRLTFTRHVREVMSRRDVTVDEVLDVVRHPEVVEPSNGMQRFVKGDLAVVVATGARPGEFAVVTVLYRVPWRWTDADMRARRRR